MAMITYKFRIKDRNSRTQLETFAIGSNSVWNFCVATQREAENRRKAGRNVRWPSEFDLIKLCTGSSAELGLHSDTITEICRQFVKSRNAKRKCPKFRASFGPRRSLGWIPYIPRATKLEGDSVRYLKRRFRLWKHREIEGAFKCGAFVQDARGRWYATFTCEVADDLPIGDGEVGIDLGLKTLAVCSDGTEVEALRHYRQHEDALATAQRAGNKPRVRAIHAKIANSRRHHLHVASARIARENRLVAVGNVNASGLAKTKMAKSVYDAGWSAFRHMLRYKCARRHAVFVEVDERMSTQACSACGCISGPRGRAGLSERQWVCADCGCEHDRDFNSAINILVSGRNVGLQCTGSHSL